MSVEFGALFRCNGPGCKETKDIPPRLYPKILEFIDTINMVMAGAGWDIHEDGKTYCPKCKE